ncbi:hypothetical protein T4B_7801, partial [Trichinella pseudospiralis]
LSGGAGFGGPSENLFILFWRNSKTMRAVVNDHRIFLSVGAVISVIGVEQLLFSTSFSFVQFFLKLCSRYRLFIGYVFSA